MDFILSKKYGCLQPMFVSTAKHDTLLQSKFQSVHTSIFVQEWIIFRCVNSGESLIYVTLGFMLRLWVIRRSLHIEKIHKNKIHSYINIKTSAFSGSKECDNLLTLNMSHHRTRTTKWYVCQAKTQISLGICPVWSKSLLSTCWNIGSLATHWAQAKALIRLGGCPGWSACLLGAQVILLVLSCCLLEININVAELVYLIHI